jgi:hypothetical protein
VNGYTAHFTQRRLDANLALYVPSGVKVSVERYSRAAVGGCKSALLVARGPRDDLYDFLNWLRVRVLITNPHGARRWWGYVARVEVYDGRIRATADLDTLANRVATAYTTVGLGESTVGVRGTTDWAEDRTSIDALGIRELLDSRGGTSAEHAVASRDRILAHRRFPTVYFERSEGDDDLRAEITCRGWWSTLQWQYARVPTRLALGFETYGGLTQSIGEDHDDDLDNVIALGQTFDVGSAINLQEIEIYVRRVGTPPEVLKLAIHENPDESEPGASLASVDLQPAEIGEVNGWVKGTLSAPLALAAGSTYFLVVSTTGVDRDNHYILPLDANMGYGAGVLKEKVGSTWDDGPAGDLPFRIYANDLVETTQQLRSLITDFGQFLRHIRLDIASGIYTESYRNGDSDAQFEIEELLEIGTSTNRRMFADVDEERNVRIWEQPASSDAILMGADGLFRWRTNAPIEQDACPAGVWVMPSNIVPSNVDLTLLLGLQGYLLEESEYVVAEDALRFTPANIEDPWDLGVRDG